MGANSSKSEVDEEKGVNYIKKQIGKRSSINILKRSDARAASDTTFADTSFISQYDGSSEATLLDLKGIDRTGSRLSAISDRSVASTVVRQHTGELDSLSGSDESQGSVVDEKEYDKEQTPRSKPLPRLRAQVSPTRGAEIALDDDIRSAHAQTRRRTASGPELFKVGGADHRFKQWLMTCSKVLATIRGVSSLLTTPTKFRKHQ